MRKIHFHEIHWDTTDDTVVLYWDLPKGAESEDIYQIWVNGKLAGETKKTHYKLNDLKADFSYEIRICVERNGCKFLSKLVFCRTKKIKEKLDVTKNPYYAKGDGETLNTAILQQAIDDCGPEQAVYIPAGIFLTGSLRLHSDMELYLEEGAVLKGTSEPKDYLPKIKSRFEGIEMKCLSGLLNLGELDYEAEPTSQNVVIRGGGTIEGGGRLLMEKVIEEEKERLKDYLKSLGDKIQEYERKDTIPGRIRPRLIHICNAKNVSISGVTLKNGASWNVHMIYSENIVTYGCRFYSRNIWNGDGWDPDSSKNCTIFDCVFDTGDDAVAIKSGKNPEGNVINRPCEHIRIFDCVCACGHGFALGSEMSGGIRDVKIWNCDLKNSAYGIEIKGTRKRGGFVRDVQVSFCRVPRILIHSVSYNDDGIAASTPPVFEKCNFSNIKITRQCLNNREKDGMESCEAIELCGFEEKEHYLKEISFENIRIAQNEDEGSGIQMKYCDEIKFENITYVSE